MSTTYRLWARKGQPAHTRWCLQGGPPEGWSLEDAAAAAIRWQALYPSLEVAVLPLHGSSPVTIAELCSLAGLSDSEPDARAQWAWEAGQ